MRKAIVLYKKEPSAELYQLVDGTFVFRYLHTWFNDERKPAISLTLPKKHQEYKLSSLFPFFFNMLPEGSNKQSSAFKIELINKMPLVCYWLQLQMIQLGQ